MKLSMWSSYYFVLTPEDMVLELEKYGYRYSELSDEHSMMLLERGDAYEVGLRFKAFADAHGLTFPQGHLKLSAQICEPEGIAIIKRQLDLFKAVGVKNAVLHCDTLKRYPELTLQQKQEKNIAALKELTDYIKDTDIVICLENIPGNELVETAAQIRWMIDAVGSDHLGICLDTGHLNLSEDKDQVAFIRTAGKYLKALHLADNDGSGDQHLMPCARGQVDFAAVFAETKKLGYEGLYNYEVPGERREPLPVLGFKLNYIRDLSQYFWEQAEA